jgi:hypothetical protein
MNAIRSVAPWSVLGPNALGTSPDLCKELVKNGTIVPVVRGIASSPKLSPSVFGRVSDMYRESVMNGSIMSIDGHIAPSLRHGSTLGR